MLRHDGGEGRRGNVVPATDIHHRLTRLTSSMLERRHFDRRAILPSLKHAVLDLLHVRYGVSEPDAGTDQKRDNGHRDDVHDHAMSIIDFSIFFFVLREIVDRLVRVGGGERTATKLLVSAPQRELQHPAGILRFAHL